METGILKKFAQEARRNLQREVSVKLDWVLKTDSAELRESAGAVEGLKKELDATSREAVVEKAAYIWFNRFCALRFMDVKGYTRMGIVSPAAGQTQPEILAEAKMGHIDDRVRVNETRVRDLLSGRIPSRDAEGEAYRLLLVAVCNDWNSKLPFLFERIADWTELLMPDDLLSEASLLSQMREVLTEENCQDVEVIGWLYQFYISEKKDAVFEALKKSKKIEAENIPAATQLFTPHWIVRYLVENSLGRLWMQNRPGSKLAERMDYYIPDEQSGRNCEEDEPSYLKIASPEEIRICDPACGSGHMLVYAFELLAAIYEEEGYAAKEIPGLVLEKNLVGIEIDSRAGSLAAFALIMKACETHRRFIRKPVLPKVCVLKEVIFTESELDAYIKAVGNDLLPHNLRPTLEQFADAAHFGSLIRPMLEEPAKMASYLEEQVGDDLFQRRTHLKVLDVLSQAEILATTYHVVVANPPYMGGKGMNEKLKTFAGKYYSKTKSDLFAMFSERIMEQVVDGGFAGLMTPFNWMFLKSFEALRERVLSEAALITLVRPEFHAFFDSAYVTICGWVISKQKNPDYKGSFIDLQDHYGAAIQGPKALEIIGTYKQELKKWQGEIEGKSETEKQEALSAALHTSSLNPHMSSPSSFFRASASDFQKIPGVPIAYWAPKKITNLFTEYDFFEKVGKTLQGMTTCDNDFYLRYWWEVADLKIGKSISSREVAKISGKKWFPYTKGGAKRKWFGNNEYVVNWENDGELLRSRKHPTIDKIWAHNFNLDYIFKEGASYSSLSSGNFSCRYTTTGFIFDQKGSMIFTPENDIKIYIGLFNSNLTTKILELLCPTLDFNPGALLKIPIALDSIKENSIPKNAIALSKMDWDSNEFSVDFLENPLLKHKSDYKTISATYFFLLEDCNKLIFQMRDLEEENNRIFNEAYGLQDELTPDVPLKEITLTCNPHYRYGNNKTEDELETLLLADTMKEFISYAVGCMFGRYSLDKPGLILANQGDTLETYLDQIPEPTFLPDDDNVIPILEEGWFSDDITERFIQFLRLTFGEENFKENLDFLEAAIGKNVRKYFLIDFYTDHVKRYKKRPIYWMFESPKKSFRCLVYMHRYQPDTVSVMLNNYLRDYRSKLISRIQHLESIEVSASAGKSEKAKAIKEMDKLRKIIIELEAWERDVIFPMAGRQIEIDLDDGVKVNYRKFDKALKKITGL